MITLIICENLDRDNFIKGLNQEDTYKYMCVNEGNGKQNSTVMKQPRKELNKRVGVMRKLECISRNAAIKRSHKTNMQYNVTYSGRCLQFLYAKELWE